MTTALIYIRQSRHKDGERTASPEVQWQACGELPAVKACTSVERYQDLDVSGGKTAGRKAYMRLLQRIDEARQNSDVAVVAAYDQSRSFRNTADALAFYVLLEKRPWITVEYVHGRFDRSPAGEFTYTAMAAAHAMERRMTAEKIRAAYAYRSAQGEAVGPVPAGYRRTGKAGSAVVIDETTAPLVRRIFEEYATGSSSTRAIAERLNAEGAILPGSEGWYGDTIAQMLANVAYIGKTYTQSRLRRQGALITGQWLPLIDLDLWEAVQRQLRARTNHRGVREGAVGRAYVFRGLLRCGQCGRPLHINSDRRARVYYRCRGDDAPQRCAAPGLREEALLPWALDLFQRLDAYRPDGFADAVAGQAKGAVHNPDAVAQVELTLDRLGKRFMWGHVEEPEYLRERERLEAMRDDLKAAARPVHAIELAGLLDAWNRGDASTRHDLLALLFDALQVASGEVVGFTPRRDREAEVTALMTAAYTSGYARRERDSNPRRLAP